MRLSVSLAALGALALTLCLCVDCHGDEKQNQRQGCGTKLPQMLSLVCDGCYNTREKRSIRASGDALQDTYWNFASSPKNKEDDLQDLELDRGQPVPQAFRERLRALDVLGDPFRSFSRGVVDECCHKSCHIDELKAYCCAT